MKRFYKAADTAATDGGHQIQLDGRPVNTPGKARLVVPDLALATAIAEEWNAQIETVEPATMPLTQLANTAVDRVARERDAVVAGVMAFAESDLLCYRAEQPAALVERQNAVWQPLLDWAALGLDAPLNVTQGVVPVLQPHESVAALARVVADLDDFHLAGIAHAAGLLGSIVLALAVANGRVTADQAFEAAHLDEAHQLERWGADTEAAGRLDRLRLEMAAAGHFLTLLDG